MTKELFVSSTPHETKVGMVEDDQLAEIYLERENEYTLAGSIYKGRVTRVLPGMQSAFVDIGLERDAFLYVSDFMELGEDQDDLEEVPTNRPVPAQAYQAPSRTEAEAPVGNGGSEQPAPGNANEAHVPGQGESSPAPAEARENRSVENRGGWRGPRRRRWRGPDLFPDSKYARAGSETPREPQRTDFGPPPGYQPIILPGESISKYQRLAQNPAAPASEERAPEAQETPLGKMFPEDEPLFAKGRTDENFSDQEQPEPAEAHETRFNSESPEWDRKQKRLHEMNVAAVFGGEERQNTRTEEGNTVEGAGSAGTLEEEEIEEEEADLAHYVEELEEDAAFEEMEEETHAADEYGQHAQEIAATGDTAAEEVPFSSEPVSAEAAEVAEVEGVDEEAEEEAELEEAQAEAEAVVEAEALANGSADARVEVRAPAATAPYTQRAPRPGCDRHGPRGRRGGRRFRRREPQNVPLITDLLKEGQEILVQIAKEPIGKKGARITSHIALPGRFLVYMPTVNHTGVSRKISSEEERQRLKRIIISERENGHGGFIVRTAAQGANEEELRADIRFLKGLWTEIKTRAENGKAPALIYHDLNVVERVLRDQVTSDFSAIWVDTEQEYERIVRFANRFQPALVRRVKLYSKETPLFEQFGLSEEINKGLKSKVWLKSGGYIVINQTEALVAIDINTGKYVGKTSRLEDTIVKTNVDAIKEIVRQIRLRDLGGIIIIDFIDMDERRNRQKVMQALEEALKGDRAPSKVLQFNDFGLVAITRKRVKQSLERTIRTPCPYCTATGYVKSVNTVCNEIYVEMRKIAKQLEHSDVMLRVNPEVAKALKTNNGRWLSEMEELTGKTIIVKSDPAVHQEQFDIN